MGDVFPIPGGTWSDTWGAPRSGGRTHKGQDIFAPRGNPIVAPADGTIVKVDPTDTHVCGRVSGDLGGRTVWLQDRNSRAWYFAHMETISVRQGQEVKAGQQLGTVGNSGNACSTSTHCHLGIKVPNRAGAWVNPAATLRAAQTAPAGGVGSGVGGGGGGGQGSGPGIISRIPIVGPVVDGVGGVISGVTGAVSTVGDFLSLITSAALWLRVLSILAGAALTAAGLRFITTDLGA